MVLPWVMKTTWTVRELANRRKLAVERVNQGYTQAEVATFLGVDVRSVRRWLQAYRQGGFDALLAKPRPGRPPHLTDQQVQSVLGWLPQSPTAFGFSTELWTAKRVAHVIRER